MKTLRKPRVLLLVAVSLLAAAAVFVVALVLDDEGEATHKLKDPLPAHHGFDIRANADRFAGTPPMKVNFTAAPFDNVGSVKWHWKFDDGTVSTEQNPTHTFSRSGYYQVVLEATDEKGNRNGWNLILGVWPRTSVEAVRSGKVKGVKGALGEVQKQQRRTGKRRAELKAKGLPVFEGGLPAKRRSGKR